MQVNIETPSALRRKVTIEIERDEIKRELDQAYNELRRGVVLKGFRPGHAPRNLLERFFGDQVRGEVIQKLVREYTEKALEENSLKPIVSPEIVTEETDLNKSLRFSATFDLRPEITVKDYEGLKVPESKIEVKDEEIEQALGALRERQGTLKKIEDRKQVTDGDYVLATVEGFVDDQPLSTGKSEDRLLEVSKRALAHGLDEILIGAEIGQPVHATRSYEADYSQKELAGKAVEWRAQVKEIYQRVLPVLDDEFAKDNGTADLAELRKKVGDDLERHARAQADARVRQGLLELVIERNAIEVPESLVERETQAMEEELRSTLRAGGLPQEQVAEQVKNAGEDLKRRAEKRARTALILDALAEQEKIQVSDEDLGDRVAKLVTEAGRARDRAAEFYHHEENRQMLRGTMRREKTLDLLLERAQRENESASS
jgi:trigger factor